MTATPAQWNKRLAAYSRPDRARSLVQLSLTLALFSGCMAAAVAGNRAHWALGLPASAAAGVFIVKLFIIQHDCGHRSFFGSAAACDWIGRGLSLLTVTPYSYWKQDHDRHHATAGDLDRRGAGDIDTLTVAEYAALGRAARARYRVYRHPAVLFGIGPAFQFLLRYRIPVRISGARRGRAALGILAHDAALAAFFASLCAALGWRAVAQAWLPALLVASTAGVWLFYVQHQFERTHWARHSDWSFVDAALRGCSYYRLPGWLHWATGNVGFHHIHHLSCRIPNYNLPRAFAEIPDLRQAPSVGILESLRCAGLGLWCERRERLVSFRDAFPA